MNPFPKNIDENSNSEEQQLMKLLQSNPELMQKYQQQLTKFQAASKSQPISEKEYMQKLQTIEKYFDEQGGITIQPTPSFVLKFLEKRTNQKIFVNIVTHSVIDHPQQKLLVDFENQPGLRIPMSMGRVREDHDKTGNICKVVDVVLNPQIVKTAESNPDIMNFTAQIIGNYLLEKYKIATNDQILKKVKGLKYKGNQVEIQRVKGRKAPKIQQVSTQEPEQSESRIKKQEQLLNQLSAQNKVKVIEPEFSAFVYDKTGHCQAYSLLQSIKNPIFLKITFDLPHLLHSRGIHLQGNQFLLYLHVKGIYEICLKMPFVVGSWKSMFSKKNRKLFIKIYPRAIEKTNSYTSNTQQQSKNMSSQDIVAQLQSDLLYDLV